MSDSVPFDVAIVGLGPVGATLAATLGMNGARVVVVERDTTPHTLPRAAHLDGHALEVVRNAGIEVEGRPIDGFDLVDRRGRLLLRGRPAESPPPGHDALLIHQPTLERALRARLADLETVDVRLGHAVTSIVEDGDHVRLGGDGFGLEAELVAGCDGARGVVRPALEAEWAGGSFEQPWLVVDTILSEPLPLPDRLQQIADPHRPTTFVPFPGDRRRWEFRLRPGETADAMTRPETIRSLLAPHVDPSGLEVERAAVYTFHDVVASRWRRGRLMLAGDAAHQMPPFLGQGLGAGLRDVASLAPLLLSVLEGAPLGVLDAYEAERRSHVEATMRQAVRLGKLITLPEPWASARDVALRSGMRVPGLRSLLLDVRG
ncbi:FAD-dependent monooxygenase [Rubrivirga sp.]|uniref:FAD-dependent monooxygenase n=1 Tax=Rubrivirga sp. TaxID=1885344 RepID=UPI003C79545F